MAEWFDNETFWMEMYPYLFTEQRFAAAEEQIDKIFELVGFQGKTVLDLCCGPGRHSISLAKRGIQVTGVDRTAFFLEKAKEKAQAEKVSVEWVLEDMRNFIRQNAYDLVLNMFTSFGYFDDKQEDLKVLQHIHQSLKSGGACVLEMMGKEILARIFQPTGSDELPDGSILVQRREIFDDWSRIRNEWILLKEGKATSFKFHHTLYSGQELKDRFIQAGFSKVKLFGNLEGMEYGPGASRLIAVGWK